MGVVSSSKSDSIVIPNMAEDWHPAVFLDHWYIWDKQEKGYKTDRPKLVDKLVVRFAMDPEDVGTIDYQGEQVQRWFDTYWNVSGQRFATEEFIQKIHRTVPAKKDEDGNIVEPEKSEPYKLGAKILKHDYARYVLDYHGTVPVHIDDKGEPDIFLATTSKFYELLSGCWKEDFVAAYKSGDISIGGLMGLQVELLTKLGGEKRDGTRWENVIMMRPGKEGQNVPVPEDYICVKDRRETEKALPF